MRGRISLALVIGAVASMAAATPGAAAVIENSNVGGSLTLDYFTIGQSFTAIDEQLVSAGFAMRIANPGATNDAFTISLYEGEGFGGPLLASRSGFAPFDLTTGIHGAFLDLSFDGLPLTIGNLYTVVISSESTRLAVGYDPANNYAGGRGYLVNHLNINVGNFGTCFATSTCDTGFRIEGYTDAGVVPEPATWALMIGGFGLAGAMLRRRGTVAAR